MQANTLENKEILRCEAGIWAPFSQGAAANSIQVAEKLRGTFHRYTRLRDVGYGQVLTTGGKGPTKY